jgi:hypothetical protein
MPVKPGLLNIKGKGQVQWEMPGVSVFKTQKICQQEKGEPLPPIMTT